MKALLVLLRFISWPELASRPIRSLLMIGTVAVGVALLVAMHISTESIVTGFAGDLERLGGKADLQITFGTGETGFSEELLEKVRAQPFVEQAAALIHSQVTFEDGPRETVELFGIDLMQEDVVALYEIEVLEREEGDFRILDDPRGIFITDVIARERQLGLGSKVRLSAVDGIHEYTVHAIVATKGLAEILGGRLIAMFLPAAQPVAGREGSFRSSMIDQIDVRVKAGQSVAEARRALEALLTPGFHVDTPMQRRVVGQHTVDGLRATLVGMSSLALLAAVFIIYASTTTSVAQRLPAMATLVTVGAGPSVLVRSIVMEAAVLGAIGAVFGVALGVQLSSFISADAAAGMGLNYSLPFNAERVSWNPLVVLAGHPLIGILAAACSAYLPARRLQHATPLVLEREEALPSGSTFSGPRSLLVAAVPGLCGAYLLTNGLARGSSAQVSAGGIVVIAAAVLATVFVLKAAWSAGIPLLAAVSGVAGRIAGENLVRSLDRSLVTASAITLSVAIAVGAGSLVQSFRTSVSGWYGFAGDALVSSRALAGGWLAAPIPRTLETQLSALDSVRRVESLRVLQGQPYRGERIAIAALSDGLLSKAVGQGRLVGENDREGAVAKIGRGEAAAVSENFLSHFGLPPDARITVSTVTGEVELPVVAVVPDYVSDKGSILIHRDLVSRWWNDHLVNFFSVDLHSGSQLSTLVEDVRQNLPGNESLAVVAAEQMIARVDSLIGDAFADIDTIKLLVLFLTAVGIADLVVSNVLSRKREMAVLRIVGLTDRQVVRTMRLEGLTVTLAAAVCGSVVGSLCAWVWVKFNYPALVGYVLSLDIAWSSILISLVTAAVAATVAGTIAGRYALRQPALSTIRFE